MTPHRWAVLVGVIACAASAVLGPAPSAVAGQRATQLSIAIDDGRSSAAVGDTLEYTISVTNTGAEQVNGLVVTQSTPAGLTVGSADNGASVTADAVTWTIDLAAGQVRTFGTSMTVSPTGGGVLRLATVACAAESPDGPPVVCAADSDLLPAGAAAAVPTASPTVQADPIDSRWWVGAGSGVVIVAGMLVLLLLQRRRDRNADRQAVG